MRVCGEVIRLLLKYCIYCASAPSLHRESTDSLISKYINIYIYRQFFVLSTSVGLAALAPIIAAMAAVKRGSSLCEGCGTSNGNRALVCKGCGKPGLGTKAKRAKRPEHVPEHSSNVTLLLDAELKAEIATAISVRVRPQGPDYRCFATKDVDGTWKCTNKDCEVVRQGRIRSMESGTSYDVFLTPLGLFIQGWRAPPSNCCKLLGGALQPVLRMLHTCTSNMTRLCFTLQLYRSIISKVLIRESVDSLCRDGADAQYMQYLSKSRITSPQTSKKLI